MMRPKSIPEAIKTTLTIPVAAKDNLSKIVEIINPVFLISCEYLYVYLKEIKSIKTTTRIVLEEKTTR